MKLALFPNKPPNPTVKVRSWKAISSFVLTKGKHINQINSKISLEHDQLVSKVTEDVWNEQEYRFKFCCTF